MLLSSILARYNYFIVTNLPERKENPMFVKGLRLVQRFIVDNFCSKFSSYVSNLVVGLPVLALPSPLAFFLFS